MENFRLFGVLYRYWQPSMNMVKAFKAHRESIRDITFCPTDMKFASGSSDQTINVWDFENAKVEQTLKGHGFDVKTVQWHPSKVIPTPYLPSLRLSRPWRPPLFRRSC